MTFCIIVEGNVVTEPNARAKKGCAAVRLHEHGEIGGACPPHIITIVTGSRYLNLLTYPGG